MEPSCTNFSGWVSHSRHLPLLLESLIPNSHQKQASRALIWVWVGYDAPTDGSPSTWEFSEGMRKISGRTKLPSLSLASPPVTEASTWAWLSYLSRPKVLLFGRDIKKVAFSLEPFSISRSILSSWSNAFLKDFHNTMDSPTALRRTQTLYRNGSVPICSLSQAIAFKCPTQIWMIFSWSMSEKARASQRVTIAKWCFQVVQSRSGTKRRAVVE